MPLPGTDDLPTFDPKSKEQNIGFNQYLALAKLQQQNNQFAAKQQQQDMSMLLRAMGSPSGNASWIGHTAMPQQPTFAPRQGMFSGILSDPWHQYLAQKEYEVRRDRAIANQMDELYRRDNNDRFDQLLALMQAQKGGTPADASVSTDATQQQSNTQSEDPFDYALKIFKDSLTTAANPEAAINAFNATMRSDKGFRELLTNSKYNSEDRNKILQNPLANLIGLTSDDINSLYDKDLSKVNLIHPYGLALIEQTKQLSPTDEPTAKIAQSILRGVGTQSINNDLTESIYRPILKKFGLGTSDTIPGPELQLAASLYNYMKGNGIADEDIRYFIDPNNSGFRRLGHPLLSDAENDVQNAVNYLKKLNFNQIGNREIYDKLAAQTKNAYIGASMADQLAARGYITEAQANDMKNRYNRLTQINPAQYENMLNLINDNKNIPMDARSLISGYTQGSAVYPDLVARLKDSTNILNSPEMQNYLSDTNNFKKFLMSSYFYGKDATNPSVKAAIDSTMNEYYKARTPVSKDLSSVVKNINTRLMDKSAKNNIDTFKNKPADNGSLYVDLLAKAEGYRDNVFQDSNGKGVYLLGVNNGGNWYLSNAKIGTKFSDLSQADQNAAYDNQTDALKDKWRITTNNLHDPNVWKYVKELKLSKSDIDDITALLASSCYRGDPVGKGTLTRTFERLKGKSNITPEDVYKEYTEVLINNYKGRPAGGDTNIRVVKSRRENVLKAYNAHKQNKTK